MMQRIRFALLAGTSCALLLFALSCGGGHSSNSGGGSGSGGSSGGGSGGGTPATANTIAVSVNPGPSTKFALTNGAYVSVTVCQPGTSTCVTVPNVLLDTGSTGLRLLSGLVSGIGLQNVTFGAQTLTNCEKFLDLSATWGPVATADILMAGEVANSVPIQVIAEQGDKFPPPPASCGGTANNTVDTLLANGILGVSFFQEDCGSDCTAGTTSNGGNYYACDTATSSCALTTAQLAQQVQNPVGLFARDNNGVILTLPPVPAVGAPNADGTLTFGVGTQPNNALGSAVVLEPDTSGFFRTTFKNVTTAFGFIDSGSSALFFSDSTHAGFPQCGTSHSAYYCPSSTESVIATNQGSGSNGATSTVPFSVGNADNLLNSTNDVFSDLAGTGTAAPNGDTYFDWGLPFFLGRSVFVGYPTGTAGPYWAY